MENQLVKQQNTSVQVTPLSEQKEFLQGMIDSGQLPTYIKKVETAWAIAQYGKELNFSPMAAFNYIISIQGKLTLSAKAKQAVLRRAGVTWKTIEDEVYLYPDGSVEERPISKLDAKGNEIKPNDKRTTIEMSREGMTEIYKFYWSDAVKAGLTSKTVWGQYPKSMSWARCFTALADRVASDLMMGFYSTEEMTDVYGVDETLIVRNDKGEILNIIESEFTVED
jgi:hypothetical protein